MVFWAQLTRDTILPMLQPALHCHQLHYFQRTMTTIIFLRYYVKGKTVAPPNCVIRTRRSISIVPAGVSR